MYWLRSVFEIRSKLDIDLLIRIYKNVAGELNMTSKSTKIDIPWTNEPFKALLKNESFNFIEPSTINSRLIGPQTIIGVAKNIEKINPNGLKHDNKTNLMKWADCIDLNIGIEMNRRTDIGYKFSPPEENLNNINELYLAAQLSRFATHVLPGNNGFIMANPKSTYLSWIPLNNNHHSDSSLQFDKDDGFISSFGTSTYIDYLNNSFFNQWKNNNYQGELSDYFPKFD
jgi:hypothetical protein